MRVFLIFCLTLLLLESHTTGSRKNIIQNPDVNQYPKVKFTIRTSNFVQFGVSVKINCTLSNYGIDTVYFLSSTCEGEIYSLKYDTSKFELIPRIHCNGSSPYIAKIPPNGKFEFNAGFNPRRDNKQIKLGFDFYEVDRYFDLQKISLSKVHDRSGKDENIIWSSTERIR